MSLHPERPEFLDLFAPDAAPQRLAGGLTWTEGPVYMPARGAVIFSDVRQNRTWAWTDAGELQEAEHPSGYQNGHCTDLEGRLVACSHGRRALLRQEYDGSWTTLADRFEGRRLNSPNDVCLHPDGSLWFSDPTYGLDKPEEGGRGEPMELPGRWVFRVAPDGTLSAPIRDRFKPNGLAFQAPDRLLLADTGDGATYLYRVTPDGGATLERELFRLPKGKTDGLRVDGAGRIWSSGGEGAYVLTPDGELLGRVAIPGTVTNLCFGGPDGTTLYLTASTELWRIETTVRGLTP